MAARCRQRLEQDVITYKAGRQSKIEIPQDRPIRRITTRFTIKVNGGAQAPAGRKNNHYLNLIKAIIVLMDGRDQKIFVNGKAKNLAGLFELGVYPAATPVIANPANNGSFTYNVTFNLDFAQNIQTLSDFTALLNAPALGSLDLIVDWGTISDIFNTTNDGTIDVDDTKCEVTYVEVFDNGADDGVSLQDALANAIDIRETIETPNRIEKEFDSFGTNEGSVDILPVPSLILSHLILAESNITDGNPALSNNVLSHIRFENVRGAGQQILEDNWQRFHDTLKADYRLANNAPAGVGWVNWVDQRQGGLRNGAVDAMKLKILTSAPADGKRNGITLFTRYIPNGVPLEARVP